MNQRVVRPPETLYEGTSDMERTTTSQAAELAEPRHPADGLRPRLIPTVRRLITVQSGRDPAPEAAISIRTRFDLDLGVR